MFFYILFPILFLPIILLFPTKIIHKKRLPKGKVIATSNHYSNLDPIIQFITFRRFFRFVGKKELCKNKFTAFFFKNLGMIPVDRKAMSPSTYKEILGNLKKNRTIFIYPEGTRNKQSDDKLQDVKSGLITFASKGECDIVPMIMYRKPKIFRKNYIIVGEPIKIEGENPKKLTKEEQEANLERYVEAMKKIRTELDEYVESKKRKKKK